MKLVSTLFWLLFLTLCASLPAYACTLKMAFKDGAKGNLIGPPGNDEGAYKDLFTEAAKRIGCRLMIVRLPKTRLHERLEAGTLDFYPGASFSEKRASYLHYIPNGFTTGEVGISRIDMADRTSLRDMRGIRLLAELGTSKDDLTKNGAEIVATSALTFERIVRMINRQRADFYIADIEFLNAYQARIKPLIFADQGLKIHANCCGGIKPMYLGFSKKSLYFKASQNTNFAKNTPLSPSNQTLMLIEETLPYKLAKALNEIASEGLSDKIYRRENPQ
jgi:hypothetical protein